MKWIYLTLIVFLFCIGTISFASAEACTPDSGYDYCWQGTYDFGTAHALAKTQITNIRGDNTNGYYLNYKFIGDKYYLYENSLSTWDNLICNDYGCEGAKQSLSSSGTYRLTNNPGDSYHGCLVFVSWDCAGDCGNPNSPNNWAWTRAAYGWLGTSGCFNLHQTCTESWTCSSWGACSGGQQTRVCVDSNNCGTTTTRPAITQTCTCNTGADTNCNQIVDRTELGIYITNWISGSVTRTDLGNAIAAWAGG